MKLLREFCVIVEDHAPIFAIGVMTLILLSFLLCCIHSERRQHEYKMELLKQGKVSIESIK